MEKKKEKSKIIYYILFGIIFICNVYIIYSNNLLKIGKKNQNDNQATKMSTQETIEENIVEKNEITEQQTDQPVEETENETNTVQEQANINNDDKIPDKMGGYEVLGKLVIEKVNINKNILSTSNDDSLKISAVKLYGPNINKVGNFCICGHNWKGMLKRALELKVGDTFYLIDKETLNRVDYKIYNIYSCMPREVDCLRQNTNGKKEVTIITCNPGGVTRFIIKAREM